LNALKYSLQLGTAYRQAQKVYPTQKVYLVFVLPHKIDI
jgi:hypothetical protein